MQARRDVFQAIADPTRRSMIGLLAGQTLTLNAIAENFRISQPAVSKHMRILAECGLVVIVRQGRERHCTGSLQPLDNVVQWAEQYRVFWKNRLDQLEELINAHSTPRHAKSATRNPKTSRRRPKK
jgi:DNA-binding transcriptional ArsR family regulator